MNPSHAQDVIPKMSSSAKLIIVPDSGHHLYLDTSSGFNKVLVKELEGVVSGKPVGKQDGEVVIEGVGKVQSEVEKEVEGEKAYDEGIGGKLVI